MGEGERVVTNLGGEFCIFVFEGDKMIKKETTNEDKYFNR